MKRNRIIALILALTMVLGTSAMASEYTVVKGDTLGKIAQKELGSSSRWKEIWEANKDTVKDPNKIVVGQKLTIPDGKTEPAPAPTGKMTPGTYTGIAMGFGGPVSVEVTVTADAITSVKATGEQETEDVGKVALGRLGNLAKTKGLEMDAVTGATYTSRGVKDALGVALAKAQGKTFGTPANGKYTKVVAGHEGSITVSTMVVNGKITVTVNAQDETEGVGSYAVDRIPGRINAAQSVNVDSVGGASVSSATIKQAVAEGLIAAGADLADWTTAPAKAEIVPTEVTKDVDVVIAGAGTAGLLAAARLIDAGVTNIILFEKQDIPGGSMATAFGGFNGTDSQIYKNWAEGRDPSTIAALNQMSTWEPNENYTGVNRALDRVYVGTAGAERPWLKQMYTTAGSLYDWMTSIGVGFYTLGVEPRLSSSPYFSPGCYSGGCGYLMEFMVDYITSRGVQIVYNTPVTKLLQENGAVTGVIAEGKDGKTWTVNAKQTMLATGSFGKNKEMLEQYHPEWADYYFNCPVSLTGDGIQMGIEAGGHVIQAGAYMPGFLATYNSHYELAFIHYMYCGMIVNVNGDEFGNITANNHAMMAAAKADPANGDTFYYVFDDAAAATIRDYDAMNFTYKAIFEKGEAIHFDTVEEAAKALNLPHLAATIEKNNACYLAGEANEWGLAAARMPYIDTTDGIWLMRVDPNPYLTVAGLDCTIDGKILTAEGEIIPGLWGAGDVIGSYEQREGFYGNGFDAGVTFGAIVGDNIAAELQK